jgi:uncharacterized membrane protein
MKRRPKRSLPAGIVAVIVLGICVIVAITEIEQLAGYRPPLIPFPAAASYGQSVHFADTPVIIAGAVAAGVGLILLACGISPGKHTVLPLARPDTETGSGTSAGIARRRLRAALRFTLTETDGVTRARLRLHRRKIKAKVATERRDPATVAEGAREALDRSLALTSLASTPRVRLRAKSTHRKKSA